MSEIATLLKQGPPSGSPMQVCRDGLQVVAAAWLELDAEDQDVLLDLLAPHLAGRNLLKLVLAMDEAVSLGNRGLDNEARIALNNIAYYEHSMPSHW